MIALLPALVGLAIGVALTCILVSERRMRRELIERIKTRGSFTVRVE